MKFIIKHEIRGRIRIHLGMESLCIQKADILCAYFYSIEGVTKAKVYERTGDGVLFFTSERDKVIKALQKFSFHENENRTAKSTDKTGRAMSHFYEEQLANKVLTRIITKLFFPKFFQVAMTCIRSLPYIKAALCSIGKGRMDVSVLDGTAIFVSMVRRDFGTASSIMFLLGIGELLEEWTHKKSVDDLARSMALDVKKVWLKKSEEEVLVPIEEVEEGDLITVRVGSRIPLDGIVKYGEAMVNQASFTGEPLPVRKEQGSYVYGGTVIEEGELTFQVKKTAGATRYEKIVKMIEESEKMKSSLEGKTEQLADRLVPYSFLGMGLIYLLTRNAKKALSVLMVDFSCALKLSMSLSVLSSMRECNEYKILVKGGRFLEAVAKADTLIFDKTGTLTKAQPELVEVVTFGNQNREDMLRMAACLEEHFPHSIANAVVRHAEKEKLSHKEMHSKVNYIVAHGISSFVNGEKVCIGSSHFIFDDEHVKIPEGEEEKFHSLPEQYSHLFLAVAGKLAAVLCIQDPLKEEASWVVSMLKKQGVKRIVMMTGDSERTAKAVAREVGVDWYCSEVLPEDKAVFVEREKKEERQVIMIGDGINDSPALSAAHAGIAIAQGAEIAREIADIILLENDLRKLIYLKKISNQLIKRMKENYQYIVTFNLGLIILGTAGILTPATLALLHNSSTLAIGLKSMTNLLKEEEGFAEDFYMEKIPAGEMEEKM